MAGLIAVLVSLNGPLNADDFTSAAFLEWKYDSQRSYIDANVGMASLIAGQNDKPQGVCIDDWFYSDIDKATVEVLGIMKRFSDHHPRAVILAIIEKHCGKIKLK